MHTDTRRYIIAIAILLLGTGLVQLTRATRGAESKYDVDFSKVPLIVGDFKGEPLPIDESLYKFLSAHGMEERIYRAPDMVAKLTLIYGTDWRTIHAPTGCYPAQGWDIIQNRVEKIEAAPDNPHPGPLEVRILEAVKEKNRELAIYCYARPGATTADWTLQGLKVATGKPGAGGMIVTLRTDISQSDPAKAQARLLDLLRTLYPSVVSFWYTTPAK